jgi:hypothetical protein
MTDTHFTNKTRLNNTAINAKALLIDLPCLLFLQEGLTHEASDLKVSIIKFVNGTEVDLLVISAGKAPANLTERPSSANGN